MPYRRFLTDFMESTTDLTFALVLRDETNLYTYGGGYMTVVKPPAGPFTDALLERALDDAVRAIVRGGNNALPRDKARIRAEFALRVKADTGMGRVLEDMARQKNLVDWPSLGVRRTRR